MDAFSSPGLGESQRTLLERVKRRGEATLAELEASIEVGRETLRSHLAALVGRGLVERRGVRRGRRGRPQIVYRLTSAGEDLFPRREGELLADLTRFLLAAGAGELLDRFFAKRRAERRASLLRRLAALDTGGRLNEIARVMSEDGFLAEAALATDEPPTLRLCHCPLRELVAVSQLPCGAEKELLEELLGCAVTRTRFRPDGDACCAYAIVPPAAATA